MTISIATGKPIPTEDYMNKIYPQLKDKAPVINTYLAKGEISVSLSIMHGDEAFREIAELLAEIEAAFQ